MMFLKDLQQRLRDTKRYAGEIDGDYGLLTQAGILLALTDGPDTALTGPDFSISGARLGVQPAAIRAFWTVEAAGAGFECGKPKILPEPHRFSRNTGGQFDKAYPNISYPRWGTRPYPATQDARYSVLLAWVKLLADKAEPIDPAFASASYGAPQIMGENFPMCGYASAFQFAEAMARDEATQLRAFEAFVTKANILPLLRKVNRTVESFEPIALKYNGTSAAKNKYAEKMLKAFIALGGV